MMRERIALKPYTQFIGDLPHDLCLADTGLPEQIKRKLIKPILPIVPILVLPQISADALFDFFLRFLHIRHNNSPSFSSDTK